MDFQSIALPTELLSLNNISFLNLNSATVRQKPKAFVAKRHPLRDDVVSLPTELLSQNINNKKPFFKKMAVRTGLEPATSCVTGRHSNQLNYRTKLRGQDLNLRPPGYEPDELPDCSTPR